MWGAETLKSSASRRTGESRKASSGLRCASGKNAFLGHNLIALITFSLQSMWVFNSNSCHAVPATRQVCRQTSCRFRLSMCRGKDPGFHTWHTNEIHMRCMPLRREHQDKVPRNDRWSWREPRGPSSIGWPLSWCSRWCMHCAIPACMAPPICTARMAEIYQYPSRLSSNIFSFILIHCPTWKPSEAFRSRGVTH